MITGLERFPTTFHHPAYLVPNSSLLKTPVAPHYSLASVRIEGNDILRVAMDYDIRIMCHDYHLPCGLHFAKATANSS